MSISAIPISRMNAFVQDTTGGWWTEGTEAQNLILNPRNDPLTARFLLARFNLMREVLREREFGHVWREFDALTQALHEHRFQTLMELYRDWFAIEMTYELDGVESEIIALCDKAMADKQILADIRDGTKVEDIFTRRANKLIESAQARSPGEFDDGVRLNDLQVAIVDANSPESVKFTHSLFSSEIDRPLRILPRNMTQAQRDKAKAWATRIAPFQHDLWNSFDYLITDLFMASNINNRLSGASAKNNRMLLVDDGIPLPEMASFLGWYNTCGIAFRQLSQREAHIGSRIFGGTAVTHILTYCAPTMPVTREHRQGSQIQTDDSHADHSLGIRSPGHHRDTSGRIVHGFSRVRTVLLARNSPEFCGLVCDDSNPAHSLAASAIEIHDAHCRMLPYFLNTRSQYERGGQYNLDAFLPGLNLSEIRDLHGRIQNPWLASGESLPFYRMLRDDPVDIGFRALSKFGRVHFRFDSRESSDIWCSRFEQTAARFLAATPREMMQYYFEAALKLQLRISTPEKPVKTPSGNMTYSW